MQKPSVWNDEPEVVHFLEVTIQAYERARGRLREPGVPKRIVEVGSQAMHDHDPRQFFKQYDLYGRAEYVGVDYHAGPGVDLIGLAHEVVWHNEHDQHVRKPELPTSRQLSHLGRRTADIVLSISALEHDPFWEQTLGAMMQLVKPGGIVAVTCAGPGWEQHELECSPDQGHYRNVSTDEIVNFLSAQVGLDLQLYTVMGWYERRSRYEPHWLRSCVVAEFNKLDP